MQTMLKHVIATMACPCNLSGFPAYGSCRSLILFHIQAGSYGNTKLDGLDIISAIAWPKAIHEGNGTTQLFVTNKANEEQVIFFKIHKIKSYFVILTV
jgi:hypothetical protein